MGALGIDTAVPPQQTAVCCGHRDSGMDGAEWKVKAGSLAVFSDWRGIRVRIWARASEEGPEVYLYGQVMTCFLQRP